MPIAKFDQLLDTGRLDEAVSLLKERLLAAEMLNPVDDGTYVPYCDRIAYRLLAERDQRAFVGFWEDFLRFVQEELEPIWGRLHKGHIYFLLGVAKIGEDTAAARQSLEAAVAEDRSAVAGGWQAQGQQADVEAIVTMFPGYITLTLLELVENTFTGSRQEKDRLCQGMVPLHFDVTWGPREVNPVLVREAVATAVPRVSLDRLERIYRELQAVHTQRLPHAAVCLAGHFLTALLAALPGLEAGLAGQGGGVSSDRLDLLLQKVDAGGGFPSETIRSTYHLIEIVGKNMISLDALALKHPITPGVFGQIAVLLKILLDMSLIEWAESLRSQ